MTSSPFSKPAAAGGDPIDLDAINGSLVLIDVQGQEHGVVTVHGPTDPISANVAVLDGINAGKTYEGALIFPRMLIGQLKGRIGEKVLGRLGKGQPKPGQSAPWVLADYTEADVALATAYIAGGLVSPSTATAGAAPF